jgi:2-aminoadipate transaminase
MFVWVTLPEHLDSLALLEAAVKRGVIFAPGNGFYAMKPALNTLRLSFSTVPPDKIRTAVGILADLIRAAI